ncbi:MAG: hypothetical protein V7K32_28765 [Nostoc sp.]
MKTSLAIANSRHSAIALASDFFFGTLVGCVSEATRLAIALQFNKLNDGY